MDTRRPPDPPISHAATTAHEARPVRQPRFRGRLPHHRRVPVSEGRSSPSGARALRRIHRWIGIVAAAFLLVLAVTGVLVNHAHDWGLDRSPVRWEWLHQWYGIPAPASPLGVQLEQQLLLWASDALWVSGQQHPLDQLVGAVASGPLLVVAGHSEMLLLTTEGELVERIGRASLPGRIERIGTAGDQIVIESDAGHYRGDADLVSWRPAPNAAAEWSIPGQAPAGTAQRLGLALSPELTWSRVVQDLHGGSLFGLGGRLMADLAAAAMIFLLVSGLVTWRRVARRS